MLTSYKKDGSPVDTQMWFVLDDGRLFVRTDEHLHKVKRIRRDSSVKVAPCHFTGKPFGEPFPAQAREMPASEANRLGRMFARKFPVGYYLEVGVFRPFFNVLARIGLGRGRGRPVFYEILPQMLLAGAHRLDEFLMLLSDSWCLALVSVVA